MMRKRMIGLVGVSAVLLLAGCTPSGESSAETNELTFVNYGGSSMEAATKGWLEPFSEETGVKFITDSPSDPAKVKAMVEAGRTTWDLIDLDTASGSAECGTLFEKRSGDVDMSEIDPQYITDDCGVPVMIQAIALVYNNDLFADNPPSVIEDFLDTEQYPGQRAIFNYAPGGLEPLLTADGVSPEEMYPIDYERAGEVVSSLGTGLTFHSELAQQNQMLESGDFAMCLCYLGRAAIAAENGANLGVVWDSAYYIWDAVYAVKGSDQPELQQEFLSYLASPEAQVGFTEHQPYGPASPSSDLSSVPESYLDFLPPGHEDEIGTPVVYDTEWWLENRNEAFDRWVQMTAG